MKIKNEFGRMWKEGVVLSQHFVGGSEKNTKSLMHCSRFSGRNLNPWPSECPTPLRCEKCGPGRVWQTWYSHSAHRRHFPSVVLPPLLGQGSCRSRGSGTQYKRSELISAYNLSFPYLIHYPDWATGWTTRVRYPAGAETAFGPALWPSQPPILWVPAVPPLGIKWPELLS